MECEIQSGMNKPVVFWVFSLQHVLIVLFFPPLAFPGINLLEMDFKRDNWAVNVIVHQTTSQGICNRTIALYCISDSHYIILRRKALLNAH